MTPVAALAKLDLVWKSHWGNRRGCVSVMGQKEKGTPPGWSFFTTLGGEYLGTHWPSLPGLLQSQPVGPPDSPFRFLRVNASPRKSWTVAAIIAARIVPATLEFLDNFTIRTIEDYSHADLPTNAAALLLIEVDGHPAVVAEEADR